MKWVIAGLLVLLVILQYDLWAGEGGMVAVWRLEDALAVQRDENARLTERNRTLAAEVEDLKQGLEAIEERARAELGMIKRGETYYQIVDDDAP